MVDNESYNYHGFERNAEKTRLMANNDTASLSSSGSQDFSEYDDILTQKSATSSPLVVPLKVPSRARSFLLMFACFFIQLATFGLSSAYGLIYVELIEVFGSTRAVAALVQSSYVGISLAGGVLVTRFIMKYDVGICMMIASSVGFISMACASLSPNMATVIVLMGVVPGLCASVTIQSSYSIISWFFEENRKIAFSVLTTGASLGNMCLPYITSALIQEYNWNGTILIISALFVLNCVLCGLIVHTSKQYYHKPNISESNTSKMSVRSILSDKTFMVYLFMLCITILFGSVEQWFGADLSVVKGFGVDNGAVLLSMNGIFGLVARTIVSIIFKVFPKSKPEIHITYSYVLWAIGHAAIVTSPVFWGMVLSMIVRGFAVGIIFACMPSLQVELRGPELFPQTLAISNLILGVSNVLGGMFCGYLTDISGSYNLVFYIAAGSACVSALIMLMITAILKWRERSKGYDKI